MSEAYNRKRDREILDNQFIAYHALIGSHLDPKKIPSFEKFIKKDNSVHKKASEELKIQLLKEAEEYYKTVKRGGE